MKRSGSLLLTITLVALSLPACQAGPGPSPTPTPITATATTAPTTATAAPVTATAVLATAAATPPSTAVCFVTTAVPVAFLPDGRHLLMKAERSLQLLNLDTWQVDQTLPAPENLQPALALSPDGKTLAWALADNRLQLVQISDGKVLLTLTGNTDRVSRVKFSPRGDRVYSAGHDTWVRLWDSGTGALRQAFQPAGADNLPSAVLGLAISPDGTQLATVPAEGAAKLWDLSNDTLIRELGGSGGYDTTDIAFSPNGQRVAANLATGLAVWNTADGASLLSVDSTINSLAVAFAPDGRSLAYSEAGEQSSVVLRAPDGRGPQRRLAGHALPVWALIFSPDSARLASADGAEVRLWDVAGGRLAALGKSACP